jgi:hypothetical protein
MALSQDARVATTHVGTAAQGQGPQHARFSRDGVDGRPCGAKLRSIGSGQILNDNPWDGPLNRIQPAVEGEAFMRRASFSLLVPVFVLLLISAAVAQTRKDLDVLFPDGTKAGVTFYSAAKPGPGVLLLHMCNTTRKSWEPSPKNSANPVSTLSPSTIAVLVTAAARAMKTRHPRSDNSFSKNGPGTSMPPINT